MRTIGRSKADYIYSDIDREIESKQLRTNSKTGFFLKDHFVLFPAYLEDFIGNPVVLVRILAYWLRTTEPPMSQNMLLLTKPSLCTTKPTQILKYRVIRLPRTLKKRWEIYRFGRSIRSTWHPSFYHNVSPLLNDYGPARLECTAEKD
jgi:hypothetical protein